MPLLGRGKTSAAKEQPKGPQEQQQVCESPLFGLRRQLNANMNNNTSTNEVPKQISRQQIHYAFAIMDTNRDGVIDVRELSQMLANLGVPIDEAILAHIMASANKRGDHRMSEEEFLTWLSEVVQVSDSNHPSSSFGKPSTSGRSRHQHQEVARSTLAAASEAPLLRNRRGSGSGLALMRSLSGGSIDSSAAAPNSAVPDSAPVTPMRRTKIQTQSQSSASNQQDQEDAREDLRAAFGVFDLDGDGFITLDEVRAGLKLLGENWSPSELRQVFARCSQSSSSSTQQDLTRSRISIDDFVQLLL